MSNMTDGIVLDSKRSTQTQLPPSGKSFTGSKGGGRYYDGATPLGHKVVLDLFDDGKFIYKYVVPEGVETFLIACILMVLVCRMWHEHVFIEYGVCLQSCCCCGYGDTWSYGYSYVFLVTGRSQVQLFSMSVSEFSMSVSHVGR